MQILIENNSPLPLYEQIVRQIQSAILTKELTPGAPLPSIRHLASELRVSVITTKRAYEELESQGFLQSTPGKGSYVADSNAERLREAAIARMEAELGSAVDTAKQAGLTLEQVQEIVAQLYAGGV